MAARKEGFAEKEKRRAAEEKQLPESK